MPHVHRSIKHLIIYASIVLPKFIFAEKTLAVDSVQTATLDSVSLESLDLKLRIIERNLEIQAEETEKNKNETATLTAGKEGFILTSADKENQLKLKLLQQVDGRFYFEDDANKLTNTFLLRRARPILEGTVSRIYKFRFMPEFAGTVGILDAFTEIAFNPNIRVRLGKSKTPFGLERFQSSQDLSLVEFAHPTSLTPNYDIGFSLLGSFQEESYSYSIGIFNGAIDGTSRDLDANDDKDIIGKIFAEPFKTSSVDWAQHFGLGIAGSFGHKEGDVNSTETPTYKTKGQQTFFSFRSLADAPIKVVYDNITKISKNTNAVLGDTGTVRAFGNGFRVNPQTYWYKGSFGLLAEYVAATQTYKKGGDNLESVQDLTTTAWQITANYVFTGEPVSFKGVKPRHALLGKEGGLGAFELALQVSKLDVDQNAFPILADPNKSALSATTWSTGLNWYLSRNTKLMSEFSWTEFDGGAAQSQNRTEEKIALIRLQNSF